MSAQIGPLEPIAITVSLRITSAIAMVIAMTMAKVISVEMLLVAFPISLSCFRPPLALIFVLTCFIAPAADKLPAWIALVSLFSLASIP